MGNNKINNQEKIRAEIMYIITSLEDSLSYFYN